MVINMGFGIIFPFILFVNAILVVNQVSKCG